MSGLGSFLSSASRPAGDRVDLSGTGPARSAAIGLVILGLALRTWGLTQWSLHGDELLVGLNALAPGDDPYQEALIMPISHAPVYLFVVLFGLDHLGLRLGAWLFGFASLLLFAWGTSRFFQQRTALAATALVAFSPWHIYFSQYARFYAVAFFFVTAFAFSLLLLLEKPTRKAVLVTGVLGAGCVYAHSYALLPVASGLSAALVLAWLRVGNLPRQCLRPIVGAGAISAMLMLPLLFVLPGVATKWAGDQTWGYSPMHTVLGIVNGMCLPTALLVAGGLLRLRQSRDWRFWIMATVGVAPVLIVLGISAVGSARQDYAFAGSAGLFILAGASAARVGNTWRRLGALLTLVILSQMPNLLSYYSCGNRFPVSQAADWLVPRVAEGDLVFSPARRLLSFYGVPENQSLSMREYRTRMKTLEPGATAWFVVLRPRAEQRSEIGGWLRINGLMEARIKPRRYDYFEHEVQIWRGRRGAGAATVPQGE